MNHRKPKKAYENLEFLTSSEARVIRILAEYLEPRRRLHREHVRDTIVFFGSARSIPLIEAKKKYDDLLFKNNSDENSTEVKFAKAQIRLAQYYEDARELAKRLTTWSLSLTDGHRFIICSGGGPGMMEAANRGASEAGGKSIGFNISLPHEQFSNPYISSGLNFDFHYFFMRKFWFMYLAKALVAFPGGFGTFDELFEVLTMVQTSKLQKEIVVVVYGKDYWNDIMNFDKFVEWGTISEENLSLFQFAETVDEAFDYITKNMQEKFVDKHKFWYL